MASERKFAGVGAAALAGLLLVPPARLPESRVPVPEPVALRPEGAEEFVRRVVAHAAQKGDFAVLQPRHRRDSRQSSYNQFKGRQNFQHVRAHHQRGR